MTRRMMFCTIPVVCMGVLLAGCMPKMTIEEMKAGIPQRPAELDRLNAFAGNWQGEGEAKFSFLDEVIKTSATSEANWEGDGWYMVSRGMFNMGELGDMTGLETWTYDTHSKKFRSTWVDSFGSVGIGSAKYDEKTDTWYMRATSHGPWGKATSKGTVKFIDENTMEWTWTEYAMGGLMKTMEMKGTSRRQ